jgi:hypothetical protein
MYLVCTGTDLLIERKNYSAFTGQFYKPAPESLFRAGVGTARSRSEYWDTGVWWSLRLPPPKDSGADQQIEAVPDVIPVSLPPQ